MVPSSDSPSESFSKSEPSISSGSTPLDIRFAFLRRTNTAHQSQPCRLRGAFACLSYLNTDIFACTASDLHVPNADSRATVEGRKPLRRDFWIRGKAAAAEATRARTS